MSETGRSVLVVQPLLAHYRYGTLSRLGEASNLKFIVAAGESGPDGRIETFQGDLLPAFEPLRNHRIGSVLWQSGLLRLVMQRGVVAVVFTGAVHDLSTWVAAVVARMSGKKVLFWTTGWTRPERGIKRILRLMFYALAHRLLLYGSRGFEIGKLMMYPERKMTVILNSQESPGRRRDVRSSASLPEIALDSRPTIVFVGRLNAEKRVDLLLESLGHLREEVRVLIVGDGTERKELERLAERMSLEVIFLGALYGAEELAPVYGAASLTVVPGRVGLTAVQSIQFGVPVVCSDEAAGQPAEWEAVIDNVTGGHFRSGDTHDLAAVITRWLAMVATEPERFREQCLAEYRQKWSADSHARRIEDAVVRELAG